MLTISAVDEGLCKFSTYLLNLFNACVIAIWLIYSHVYYQTFSLDYIVMHMKFFLLGLP